MIKLVLLEENKCEGGWLRKYSHLSTSLKSVMKFSIYLPGSSKTEAHYPAIYCLAGLSTGYERFPTQSGFARHAL
jgi:S-formylglutathione hydrolase